MKFNTVWIPNNAVLWLYVMTKIIYSLLFGYT